MKVTNCHRSLQAHPDNLPLPHWNFKKTLAKVDHKGHKQLDPDRDSLTSFRTFHSNPTLPL